MNSDNEKLRIHFIYCVAILVLLLIAVATDRWTTQQRFTEYLSNAATLTSLVLALVAIFYSFIANDGLSKSLGNIVTVADEVKQSKDQISEYLDLAKLSTNAARENADTIVRVSADVNSSLLALNSALSVIKTETETLNNTVSCIPDRLNQLENNVLDATKTLGEKTQIPSTPTETVKIDDKIAMRFLKVSSLSSNLLTYACVLANQKNRELNLAEFSSATEIDLENYLNGFLACMDATQLVKRVTVEGKKRVYHVKEVHQALLEGTKEYITSYLNRAYKSKPETLSMWLERLQNVEKLLA